MSKFNHLFLIKKDKKINSFLPLKKKEKERYIKFKENKIDHIFIFTLTSRRNSQSAAQIILTLDLDMGTTRFARTFQVSSNMSKKVGTLRSYVTAAELKKRLESLVRKRHMLKSLKKLLHKGRSCKILSQRIHLSYLGIQN